MAGRRIPRLAPYQRKRHFEHTPEPAATPRGRRPHAPAGRQFVIHLHHARRRHFDLRLQVGGVLRSWAVPKGPSRDPSIKHLAVEVEDHPLSYGSFEGTIPEGHCGAGTVAIWDEGTWSTEGSTAQQIDDGHLAFRIARLAFARPLVWLRPPESSTRATAGSENAANSIKLRAMCRLMYILRKPKTYTPIVTTQLRNLRSELDGSASR